MSTIFIKLLSIINKRAIAVILIEVCLLSASRSSHGITRPQELDEPRGVRCGDYFESRQNWFLSHKRISKRLDKGMTLYNMLAGYGVSPRDIVAIDVAMRPFLNLTRVRAGQPIDIWLNKRSERVEKISVHLSPEEVVHITRIGDEFLPSLVSPLKITIPTVIGGEVSSCFYQSAVERGIPPDAVLQIADIFAWEIDFLVDIRRGDRFQVVFNRYYRKGTCIGHGKVLAVRFVNQNSVHESFHLTDCSSRPGYYDRDGRSMRKAFLKSPLSYRRISSYFSRRRLHPVLKIYRPHHGVDYAAPIGTPVESVGDGRITFMGWNGGYGRYIKIRHNHIYETCYGHLSRFTKGLKKGLRVRQGDVIGYVGSSGLSTGPHLDFSVIRRGRFIDPIRIKSPPMSTLSGQDKKRLEEFIIQMEQLWREYLGS
jgi:murein DD-endopeptidase MepM/ murein hydrolase activator NlpD